MSALAQQSDPGDVVLQLFHAAYPSLVSMPHGASGAAAVNIEQPPTADRELLANAFKGLVLDLVGQARAAGTHIMQHELVGAPHPAMPLLLATSLWMTRRSPLLVEGGEGRFHACVGIGDGYKGCVPC